MAIEDEIRHQRQRLKGKGWKAYVSYFFTYYTWHVVIAVAVIIAVYTLISTVLNHKDQAIGVIFMNAQMTSLTSSSDYGAEMEDAFEAYAGIDTSEYEASVDTSIYQTPGCVEDSYDISASEKVSVQAAAGTLDALVADASNFRYYTYSLAILDLREVLSEEQLEQYADRLYYVDLAEVDAYQAEVESAASTDGPMTAEEGEAYEQLSTWELPDPATMKDPVPVGIEVTDSPVLQRMGIYPDVAVIYGFVQTLGQPDNAVLFLEYLLEE